MPEKYETVNLPQHIAVIMDGNGRWAQNRKLPRIAGHHAGLESVRSVVKTCSDKGIKVLTLFAFSSENWTRPSFEVGYLMQLFVSVMQREVNKLHKNNVQVSFIGDHTRLSTRLHAWMAKVHDLTANNTGLKLVIALDYGGRWDILNATRKIAAAVASGELKADEITPEVYEQQLSTYGLPEPDLLIRTSGEMRISNFLLWQLAYTELYFTSALWPDFNAHALEEALSFYAQRQRRFGNVMPKSSELTPKDRHHA